MNEQSLMVCIDGSKISNQRVSHFYKFDIEGQAYCVFCGQTINETMINYTWSQAYTMPQEVGAHG